MHKHGLVLLFLVIMSTVGGCSSRADLETATGVVTFNGEPVADAKIMLHPLNGGPRNSYGTTNEKGEFKLSTFGLNDGALVGRSAVSVSKVDQSSLPKIDTSELATKGYGGASYEAMMGPGAFAKAQKKVKYILPAKYADHATSGIEVDVVKGEENHFTLDITE